MSAQATPSSQSLSAQQIYDSRAPTYDDSWHPVFASYMVSLASLTPGSSVLDLACGTGLATMAAARAVGPSGRVVGVDVSAGMLAEARAKVAAAGAIANVSLHRHDITDLAGIADGELAGGGQQFDAVTCASALVLLDDPAAAVAAWAARLRPGGVLVVDATSPHNHPGGIVMERTARRLGAKVPWNRDWSRSEESLRDLLEGTGVLVVEKVEPKAQTGLGTRWIDVDKAGAVFDEHVAALWGEWLGKLAQEQGDGVRAKARRIFEEEWTNAAEDGKVRDEDLVWVALARKKD